MLKLPLKGATKIKMFIYGRLFLLLLIACWIKENITKNYCQRSFLLDWIDGQLSDETIVQYCSLLDLYDMILLEYVMSRQYNLSMCLFHLGAVCVCLYIYISDYISYIWQTYLLTNLRQILKHFLFIIFFFWLVVFI